MPLDRYVVDFCCEAARLIVELDGGQHAERSTQDAERAAALEARGYLVLRFWNDDVLRNTDGVVESIINTLNPSPPLPNGERERARTRG